MIRNIYFIFLLLIVSCNNKTKTTSLDETNTIVEKKILNSSLEDLFLEYSKEFPLKQNVDSNTNTLCSYNITFLRFSIDTIVTIVRQPFIFGIFPDFLYKSQPIEVPIMKGIFYVKDQPIIIFDEKESIGANFYVIKSLTTNVPEKYFAKFEKTYDYIIPPIWKFKIENKNKLIFIEKTDTVIVK